MKTHTNLYKFLLFPLLLLFSCTDSTTEDGTSVSPEELLFIDIEETMFTGVYDTMGYTLLVNNISAELYQSLENPFVKEDSIREVLCGNKEGGCMEAMEQYYIAQASDKVIRKGNELKLALAGGGEKIMANNLTEGDDYEVYQFYKRSQGYYIVAVFYYESYGYYLISEETGKATFTIGMPVLSPDQKLYAAANYDMVAAFTYNGLELLTFSKDSVAGVLKIDFATWGPEEVKWKDDSTLYVKQKSQHEEGPEENNYAAIRIRKSPRI